MRLAAACAFCAALPAAAASAAGTEPAVLSGPAVSYTISDDGLSSVSVGGRRVAAGGWFLFNADTLFKAGSGRVRIGPPSEKAVEGTGPGRARVRHAYGDASAVFDYELRGEDLVIRARVENAHPAEELAVAGFRGLTFDFGKAPEGIMQCWHASYLQAVGTALMHPGHHTRIGGSWAAGEGFGVGLTPLETGWSRTLFLWDLPNWGKQAVVNPRPLQFYAARPVPPRGARSYAMLLRVSANTDWKHLLQPYREHFTATFGPVRYESDPRLFAVAHVNRDAKSIGPQNPYGFHGGFRRLDLREGVAAFCDTLIPALEKAGGQGVIIWGQGGSDPRGAMYRPDFDILPPEVEANWPALAARFREKGLRLGVTARPGEMAVRATWAQDTTVRLNADDPRHLELMWSRFKRMIDLGCTAFYLDTFGNSLEDVRIMRYLREKMGPGIATFVEHQCDAVMPFSAAYSETDYWEKGSAPWVVESLYAPRSGLRAWEVYRWLVPGCAMISRLYDVHGTRPAGFEPVERFFYRNAISPMVEDYILPGRAEELRRLQDEFLNAGRAPR